MAGLRTLSAALIAEVAHSSPTTTSCRRHRPFPTDQPPVLPTPTSGTCPPPSPLAARWSRPDVAPLTQWGSTLLPASGAVSWKRGCGGDHPNSVRGGAGTQPGGIWRCVPAGIKDSKILRLPESPCLLSRCLSRLSVFCGAQGPVSGPDTATGAWETPSRGRGSAVSVDGGGVAVIHSAQHYGCHSHPFPPGPSSPNRYGCRSPLFPPGPSLAQLRLSFLSCFPAGSIPGTGAAVVPLLSQRLHTPHKGTAVVPMLSRRVHPRT